VSVVVLVIEAIAVGVCLVSVVVARRARNEVRRLRAKADWSEAKNAAKGFDR
jgi:hypothetical protein